MKKGNNYFKAQEAFVMTLIWFVKKNEEITRQFVDAQNELNKQFNDKMHELTQYED